VTMSLWIHGGRVQAIQAVHIPKAIHVVLLHLAVPLPLTRPLSDPLPNCLTAARALSSRECSLALTAGSPTVAAPGTNSVRGPRVVLQKVQMVELLTGV
jgi:hypothetical protein